MISFLNDVRHTRIRREEGLRIETVIQRRKDKYENESHFIRCAILKLLREEGF